MSEEKKCLKCTHKPICLIKKEAWALGDKWGGKIKELHRLLLQIAETCIHYKEDI